MAAVDLSSSAPPAASVLPTELHAAATAVVGGSAEDVGRATFDRQPWTYRNGFDAVLRRVPSSAWQNPPEQGWQLVKRNARREVWRAQIGGASYYLKYYGGDGWRTLIKGLFRDPACRAEWDGGVYALRANIAAVAPAGYTTGLIRAGKAYALLVTEAAEPAHALNDFWQQVQADGDDQRRRRDMAQLVELLGELIAHAHQAGFEHLDMHAANILVQPVAVGRYRTLFVDLQSARLGVPISDRAVVRNLAQLNQWFRRHSSIADRLRFLRAYVRWRNEYEQGFPYARPLRLSFRGLVRALARAADRHARRLWARRDRRARRDGRYYARLRLPGGWRGMALVCTKHQSDESRASHMILERSWWRGVLADPLRWFGEEGARTCKDSHSADVRRAVLPHADGNIPVIVKRPRARNWRRRLSRLLSQSRSVRGWRRGHALLHRDIPAARPLAALERWWGPFVRDSLLITEAIPGAVDMETYLRRQYADRAPALWCRHKQVLCTLAVQQVRRLEERGFVHRDCKASNILVVSYPYTRLLWVDMDGLRAPRRRRTSADRLRLLVCLHVSLLEVPGLTRTDRVRFLKSYCAHFGGAAGAWRTVWRQLAPRIEKKVRAKQARREWKRKQYGRE